MNKDGAGELRRGRYIFVSIATVVLFIAAYGLMAAPMFAEAKGRFGQPRSADEVMQTLTGRLDLTPEQAAAVRPVIQEKVNALNEIRSRAYASREERRAEMRRVRWDTDIRLSDILTDDQIDRYLALKQEQRKAYQRGGRHGGWMKGGVHRTPEEAVERLRSKLDLTDEQVVQAGPIIRESVEKRRALFEKYREEGRKGKQAMREEMRAIGDETHAKLAPIFNDDQLEALETMKGHKRERIHRWMDRRGPGAF